MDEDCLKLSAYFDERQRTGGRFLTDLMIDLYEQRQIGASVVLRGAGGFGSRRNLRTDRSLSLSEDPPVAVLAVDTRARIENLLDALPGIGKRGLFTLERARLIQDGGAGGDLSGQLHETTKLTIYVGRKQRVNGIPAYLAACDLMHRRGLAGASVFLGVDGTARGRRQRAHFFDSNADVPVLIVAVGAGAHIATVLPELSSVLGGPLVTVERVRICKRDGVLLASPHALPGTDERGLPLWQKLTVYTGASDRCDGDPIHRGLLRRLRQHHGARGATVLRGIWGFHGDHRPHGDRLFALARDVPVVTIVIDTPGRIAKSFEVIDELTGEQGLVTSELVPALVAADSADDGGHAVPPPDRRGA